MRDTAQELTIAMRHVPSFFLRRRLKDGHAHKLSVEEVQVVLADARKNGDFPANWTISDLVPTVSDVAVVQIGEPQHPFAAYLKLARSSGAAEGLLAQSRTLAMLQAIPELQEWRHLLPRAISQGQIDGSPYILESALSGSQVVELARTRAWSPALHGAASTIRKLHNVGGTATVVDEELFSYWVDSALQTVSELPTSWTPQRQYEVVELLRRRLQRGLLGRSVWVSRTHGDYSPNNVLADRSSGRITGILDWDRSLPNQPAFLDIGQFAIGAEHTATRTSLGVIVRNVCERGAGASEELALLDDFWMDHPGDRISSSVVALMTLLRHVQSNIDKAPRYASHRLWIYRTIETALGNFSE